MLKKLNIYNHTGVTEADNKAILEAIENEIELEIDESGRVWNEGGEYIADAEETEKGDGIGCKIRRYKNETFFKICKSFNRYTG